MLRRAPLRGLRAGEVVVPAATDHYLTRVLRLSEGDRVELFDPEVGVAAIATLGPSTEGGLVVRVGEPTPAPTPAVACTLIYALSKGDKVDAVVRDATELGAAAVVVAVTERSVIRLDEARSRERLARWERVASEASRQCGRAAAPAVRGPLALADALASVDAGATRVALSPHATAPLGPILADVVRARGALALAVGPEGGFSDREMRELAEGGFVAARLGASVLRTETVAAAALGALRVYEE